MSGTRLTTRGWERAPPPLQGSRSQTMRVGKLIHEGPFKPFTDSVPSGRGGGETKGGTTAWLKTHWHMFDTCSAMQLLSFTPPSANFL